jgi:hypothetical protein
VFERFSLKLLTKALDLNAVMKNMVGDSIGFYVSKKETSPIVARRFDQNVCAFFCKEGCVSKCDASSNMKYHA